MNSAEAGSAFVAAIDRDARRRVVLRTGPGGLDGIDFVEVLSNRYGTPGYVPGAPSQRTLLVHLLKRPVPAAWSGANVAVSGGVRLDPALNPVRVEWAYPVLALTGSDEDPPTEPLPGVRPTDRRLVAQAVPAEVRPRVLVVRTSSAGDFSTYLLRLLDDTGHKAPAGLDPALAEAPFTFKVDCPTDLDCASAPAATATPAGAPMLDYLARDYAALRSRLVDRLAGLLPGWRDRNPADVGVTLVELFAYLGDRLSYQQDAVATEAYLGTARRRTSARRHARLLDYRMHDGCAARVWLTFTTDSAVTLPAHTPVADTMPPPGGTDLPTGADVTDLGGVVMETCAPVPLDPDRNALPLYAWGDDDHCLPAGSTAAFVVAGRSGSLPPLARGDVLVLADLPSGTDGTDAPDGVRDGDPASRFAVRLVADPVPHVDAAVTPPLDVLELRWGVADALSRSLRVSEPGGAGEPVVRAVALANVALADQGASVGPEDLEPAQVPTGGRAAYEPRIRRTDITVADPLSPADGPTGAFTSAAATLAPRPDRALAAVSVDDGQRSWRPRPDLLAGNRLTADFVVETEADGVSRLRFGDGVVGRRPSAGARMQAWYRLGGGAVGNVAADRLTHLLAVPGPAGPVPAVPDGADVSVWNPLPATGGVDPQALPEVQLLAPQAFRTQLRAVTSADYADVAMADPLVQRAVARRRWTGSWYAQEVTLDPVAGAAADPDWTLELAATLEIRRMAGVDVELADPVMVPLEITIQGCVLPGHQRAQVTTALLEELSTRVLRDGRRGFWHPDNFSFGEPLYLSDLVAAAMRVPGLMWIDVTRFARAGAGTRGTAEALASGRIAVGAREVLRCDNDPSNPEAGSLEVVLKGGS
ncbi:putative baseplate assembly protein [Actinopolymorpha rutila]|uniref:Baseplate assembly protein n=1 Tax=Actinopolymorpha rutila TaxID=446787 RepID=A0A852ZGM5_9ACTN|nr:putative baseplate assembly protein [Actinopolymorpha rutila]NYH90822.1 hypothetical protein [Actinopolymorpha rutila]